MILRKNQKIILIHTGQKATVIKHIDTDTVEVKLSLDNTIIPIDIQFIQTDLSSDHLEVNNKDSYDTYESGICIFLIPVLNDEKLELSYQLYFSNGTEQEWLIEIEMKTKEKLVWRRLTSIESNKINYIEQFRKDWLNNKPSIAINLIPKLMNGTGKPRKSSIRLQAKNFSKYLVHLFDGRYCYKIPLKELEELKLKKLNSPLMIQKKETFDQNEVIYRSRNVLVDRECDLHIEKIKNDYGSLSNSSIIKIQMDHFQKYLDNVIVAGLDRVFIIHGMGKGVLKNRIHEELKKRNDIRSYVNEFHPRYGWGATEIILN